MAWEKFEIRKQGRCKVADIESGEVTQATYEMGVAVTGKQRVYAGEFISITVSDEEILGRGGSGSYIEPLQDCNRQLEERSLQLLVVGNLPRYSESGLSSGGGFGYDDHGHEARDIMSFCDFRSEGSNNHE